MNKLKQIVSVAPKPLLLQIGIIILLVLLPLWWIQQRNVDALNQRILDFKQQVDKLPVSTPLQNRLALEKDRLILEKDLTSLQNGIYTSLAQAIGAAFFFVTAYLTWRNVKATEEKQVTERFSKAVELLASDKLEARLGGIYALERVANDSPKDYWTIMEVLTAFARNISKKNQPHDCTVPDEFESDDQEDWWVSKIEEIEEEKRLRLMIITDIQAVLTVLTRRSKAYGNGEANYLDLSGTDFSWLEFPATTSFRQMDLSAADFSRAILEEVDLSQAQLRKAYFTEASLEKAILADANLEKAWLARANLTRANLQNANLRQADLRQVDFTGASLRQADLRDANLIQVKFEGADLRGADLRGASFLATAPNDGKELEYIRRFLRQAFVDENTKFSEDIELTGLANSLGIRNHKN